VKNLCGLCGSLRLCENLLQVEIYLIRDWVSRKDAENRKDRKKFSRVRMVDSLVTLLASGSKQPVIYLSKAPQCSRR
jgi:hypothetical protein